MLHIILFILKIIGIILLVLLGLILLMVCSALFVPVRYRVTVTRKEGEEEPPVRVKAKITWLLHIVNIHAEYPAEVMLRVRLFFITLFRLPNKKAKEKPAKETSKWETSKEETPKEQLSKEEPPKEEPPKETSETQTENSKTQERFAGAEKDKSAESENIPHVTIKREAETQDNEKVPLKDKLKELWISIKKLFIKIKDFFQNIQYTIQNFCDKIKSILDNIQYYREIIESETFRQSFLLCKDELGYLFCKLKPDKFHADFIIGMDDPATTGEILAIYGMLYPLLGANVNIIGDFESKRIEGNLYLRGHIRMFTFLKIAVKVYFNKDIKKLIKLLKKEAV